MRSQVLFDEVTLPTAEELVEDLLSQGDVAVLRHIRAQRGIDDAGWNLALDPLRGACDSRNCCARGAYRLATAGSEGRVREHALRVEGDPNCSHSWCLAPRAGSFTSLEVSVLYLDNPQEIEGVTIYPDSQLPHAFYLVPAAPRLRLDAQGKPIFQLIKFRGGERAQLPKVEASTKGKEEDQITAGSVPTVDGELAGGILTFDTEYVVADDLKEKIRAQLDEQVRGRFARENRQVPEGFKIELRTPTWTDGDLHLLLEDNANGLFTCVSKSAKPSLMGNNVASFAAVLSRWQATLMEDAVKNGNFAPVQVNYGLKFLAKLPPVRISISASAVDCYSMYKTYGSEINGGGACSDPDTVVRSIAEYVYKRDVVRISIDSGGLTLDDKTFQALQEMALGLVQDWIKQEFYKPPPERATKEQLQDIQLQRKTERDFRSLSINIEQSATVEFSIYPQGTMARLITDGTSLKDFVREVDLSKDEFFQDRTLSTKVYADFPAAGAAPAPTDVVYVEVSLFYGDGPGKTMTWDATGTGDALANGTRWNEKWHKVPGVNEVRWEAKVQFREQGKAMTLQGTTTSSDLNIPVTTPGRARLSVSSRGMPWALLQYVDAKVHFRQAGADPEEIVQTLRFDDKSDTQLFDEAIWTKRTAPFRVSVSYRLKNGNLLEPIEFQDVEVQANTTFLDTPFPNYLTVTAQALYTPPTWLEDKLDLVYVDPDEGYELRGELTLSEKGGWRQNWSVPLLDVRAKKKFKYFWTRRHEGGGTFSSADLPGVANEGWLDGDGESVLAIGDPNSDEDCLRINVDPFVMLVDDWDTERKRQVIKIVWHCKYQHAQGVVDIDSLEFVKGDKPLSYKQFIRDKSKREYAWWAEYYTKPYSKILIGSEAKPIVTATESITLEPPSAD